MNTIMDAMIEVSLMQGASIKMKAGVFRDIAALAVTLRTSVLHKLGEGDNDGLV